MDERTDSENTEATGDGMMTVAMDITIAGEKVRFTISIPEGPASWEHLLPFMRSLVHVGGRISQEQAATRGKTISCRAGCGICCRQWVPIAEFEAHRLRRLVDSLPEPRRSGIIQRFRAAEETLIAAGEEVPFQNRSSTPDELIRRTTRYFRLMIACPFLENESCSIYEERPLKCREYLVTSPAENCQHPESPSVEGLPMPLAVYRTTLLLDADDSDSAPRWVPLTELMSWTDAHSPPAPSRTGPELLQEFMSLLSQPAGRTAPPPQSTQH